MQKMREMLKSLNTKPDAVPIAPEAKPTPEAKKPAMSPSEAGKLLRSFRKSK